MRQKLHSLAKAIVDATSDRILLISSAEIKNMLLLQGLRENGISTPD